MCLVLQYSYAIFLFSKLNYKNVARMIDIQRHAFLSTCNFPFSFQSFNTLIVYMKRIRSFKKNKELERRKGKKYTQEQIRNIFNIFLLVLICTMLCDRLPFFNEPLPLFLILLLLRFHISNANHTNRL